MGSGGRALAGADGVASAGISENALVAVNVGGDREPVTPCDIAVAARIHERVVPRLCSVALVLGAEGELPDELRGRCEAEVTAALLELRAVLLSSAVDDEPEASLAGEVRRWRRRGAPVRLTHSNGVRVPRDLEGLVCGVVGEAVRNALRHGTPSEVHVDIGVADGELVVLVVSDGAAKFSGTPVGLGLGLRLGAAAAEQRGGRLHWGSVEEERWQVRLTVPMPRH